eukprot:GHUV01012725.1.p1 GENE.GHUV01012725.1~~GHUV01012725.1.p1  ORF type:complete len:289 (+),score=79.69 GHUV01012725.1:91-957(+)
MQMHRGALHRQRATNVYSQRRSGSIQFASNSTVRSGTAATQQLEVLLQRLPGMAAVLPGYNEVKQQLLDVIEVLEQQNPYPNPLQASSRGQPEQEVGLHPVPELLGDWDLVFASNGTVITRTQFAQALVLLARQLPGVGLKDIVQSLSQDSQNPGCVCSTNEAEFGFGPFGSWHIGIKGSWKYAGPEQPADTALVQFDQFDIQLTGWLGLSLPQQLPQVSIPLPGSCRSGGELQQQQWQQQQPQSPAAGSSQLRPVALWSTTYLDDLYRVGRAGSSGNVFLFRRRHAH